MKVLKVLYWTVLVLVAFYVGYLLAVFMFFGLFL